MVKLNNDYFIDAYLEEVKKRSPGSFANNKLIIKNLTNYIEKSFQDINMIDMQSYLINVIDKKDIKKSTKNSKRYMLKAFFNFIQRILLSYNVEFHNPIPSKKLYRFTTNLDDIEYIEDSELKVLTIAQIEIILNYCKDFLELRDFVLIGLDICSGARISEIRTIMRKDINLKKCQFQTGFIPGARKTTLHTGKGLLFFFPLSFAKYIQKYLESCNKCDKWLFPGYKTNPLSRSMVQDIITKIRKGADIHFTWHFFRRTIITERKKMGCEQWLSEGLSNHAPSSVQERSYIKLTIKEKQGYYNQFFPYKNISYF